MKKLYWHPPAISRAALLLVCCVAITALALVEIFPQTKKQALYQEKVAAATLAQDAMGAIKQEKQRRGLPIDKHIDPAETGLIGESVTPVTSNTGYIEAKLTSTNPNFAAVIVQLLTQAGVKPGGLVAVGVSGSFPALNISTFAALKSLKLRPIIIASASSSEFGANHVEYLWLDMESTLNEKRLFEYRSYAASLGGIDDRGVGMSDIGREALLSSIRRNQQHLIESKSLKEAIDKRMEIYLKQAGAAEIAAYINVGGGSASVGTYVGKKQFKPGLNERAPRGDEIADSVMLRFADRGIPIIHLTRIQELAERYGLPFAPKSAPPIGESFVYQREEPNRWLAGALALVVILTMLTLIRTDFISRWLARRSGAPPETMV